VRPGHEKTEPIKADHKPGRHLVSQKSAGKRRNPPEMGPTNRPQTVPEEKRGDSASGESSATMSRYHWRRHGGGVSTWEREHPPPRVD
jgi:hypothetical protein